MSGKKAKKARKANKEKQNIRTLKCPECNEEMEYYAPSELYRCFKCKRLCKLENEVLPVDEYESRMLRACLRDPRVIMSSLIGEWKHDLSIQNGRYITDDHINAFALAKMCCGLEETSKVMMEDWGIPKDFAEALLNACEDHYWTCKEMGLASDSVHFEVPPPIQTVI